MNNLITQNPKKLKHILLVSTLWILAMVWWAICIGLSSQNGEDSGELSRSFASTVTEIFNLPNTSIMSVNRCLRTLAHVVCFFVLSGLIGCACAVTFPAHTLAFMWPLIPCILFAFWDEFRKAEILGRHCSIAEAWLNVLGCVLGCVVLGIFLWILRRKTAKRL